MRRYFARIATAAAVVGAVAVSAAAAWSNQPGARGPSHAAHPRGGGSDYVVTVHPSLHSTVSLVGQNAPVELYRQDGAGAVPAEHAIVLRGGQFQREQQITVRDPRRQIARIIVDLYSAEHRPGRRDDEFVERVVVAASASALGASTTPTAYAPPEANDAGYDVTVHSAFFGSVARLGADGSSTGTWEQVGTLGTGGTYAPPRYEIALRGGEFARDVEVQVDDPRHQIGRITLELYAPGAAGGPLVERVIVGCAKTCPPYCIGDGQAR